MWSCCHATRLISNALDAPLSWGQRISLTSHLLVCRPCRRFQRAVRWLHGALAAPPAEVRLPADARDRIQRALEHAAGNE
jgi:hypothetical protein